MDASELPTDVEELKALLVATLAAKEKEVAKAQREISKAQQQAAVFEQKVTELASTVSDQQLRKTSGPLTPHLIDASSGKLLVQTVRCDRQIVVGIRG